MKAFVVLRPFKDTSILNFNVLDVPNHFQHSTTINLPSSTFKHPNIHQSSTVLTSTTHNDTLQPSHYHNYPTTAIPSFSPLSWYSQTYLQKVPKFRQMDILGIRNFRKKARKLKWRLITPTMHFFGNHTQYNFYVVNFVEKRKKFQKHPEICRNKQTFHLFFCVHIDKLPQSQKIPANGIRAICHFLQVCTQITFSSVE